MDISLMEHDGSVFDKERVAHIIALFREIDTKILVILVDGVILKDLTNIGVVSNSHLLLLRNHYRNFF